MEKLLETGKVKSIGVCNVGVPFCVPAPPPLGVRLTSSAV
jgi:hypothetical protein